MMSGGGRAADAHGHPGAFAVTVGAAVTAAALAAVSQPLLRRLGGPAGTPAGASADYRPGAVSTASGR